MALQSLSVEMADQIAFIGESLGLFFTHDPKLDERSIRPLFEAFAKMDARAAARDWPFVDDEGAFECISEMQRGLSAGPVDQALYWEYRRLFVGPQKKAAPPWGSVYMDKDQVIFGSTTMKLHDWMRRNGIGFEAQKGDEPEDHIGIMLVMMAYIARNKADRLEEFLRLHVLTWASHFLAGMYEQARHPFYKALARLTQQSLEGIQRALEITVSYPRFYK